MHQYFFRWPYISNQIISKGGMVIRTKWQWKCVIFSPTHSSELQGSAFQPKWSLYVITIDRGLIVNSEEKLENETVFVIWQQKNIANKLIIIGSSNVLQCSVTLVGFSIRQCLFLQQFSTNCCKNRRESYSYNKWYYRIHSMKTLL
jgi:hypothetical protein